MPVHALMLTSSNVIRLDSKASQMLQPSWQTTPSACTRRSTTALAPSKFLSRAQQCHNNTPTIILWLPETDFMMQ